jgi:hypothetical protein
MFTGCFGVSLVAKAFVFAFKTDEKSSFFPFDRTAFLYLDCCVEKGYYFIEQTKLIHPVDIAKCNLLTTYQHLF